MSCLTSSHLLTCDSHSPTVPPTRWWDTHRMTRTPWRKPSQCFSRCAHPHVCLFKTPFGDHGTLGQMLLDKPQLDFGSLAIRPWKFTLFLAQVSNLWSTCGFAWSCWRLCTWMQRWECAGGLALPLLHGIWSVRCLALAMGLTADEEGVIPAHRWGGRLHGV